MYEEEEQVSLFGPDTWSGKMSPEPSAATAAEISQPSSKKRSGSQNRKLPMCLCLKRDGLLTDACTMYWDDGQLLGQYITQPTGAFPSEGREYRLSQILEEQAHPKYSLSARACLGILTRAERRGKALPEPLKKALEAVIQRGTE